MNVTNVRNYGNLQTNYMWRVWIPRVPTVIPGADFNYLGALGDPQAANSNLTFTALTRSLTVPGKTRDTVKIRFLNTSVMVSMGDNYNNDNKITLSVIMDEGMVVYRKIKDWYESVMFKGLPLFNPEAEAFVELIDLSGSKQNIVMKFIGLTPTSIPDITDLNQENTEGYVTMEITFSFDDIEYDYSLDSFNQNPFIAVGLNV